METELVLVSVWSENFWSRMLQQYMACSACSAGGAGQCMPNAVLVSSAQGALPAMFRRSVYAALLSCRTSVTLAGRDAHDSRRSQVVQCLWCTVTASQVAQEQCLVLLPSSQAQQAATVDLSRKSRLQWYIFLCNGMPVCHTALVV